MDNFALLTKLIDQLAGLFLLLLFDMAFVLSHVSLLLDRQDLIIVNGFKGHLPALFLSPIILKELINVLVLVEAIFDRIAISSSTIQVTVCHINLCY